jgi:hypothetical protein
VKWQARTICTFVAATVPMEKAGDVNPLLEAAQQIGMEGVQNAEGDDSKPNLDTFDPENPPIPSKVNSFEGFMGSFGSPARWAGR